MRLRPPKKEMTMIWLAGIAWILAFLFALSLCRAAKDEEER